jgi:3-hydroxybutyryl-CoA dehydratase
MHVGDKYQHEFIVASEVYEGFLATFKDRNPLHTDSSFAASKGFKAVVMHGNILNGFVSYFVGELLPIKDVMIMQQEIKYHLPVFLNDTLFFTAIQSAIFESVNAMEFKFEFSNKDNKKVAKGKLLIGII